MKKKTYTKEDIKEFDRLLTITESKGFDNYNRNIGRINLDQWLRDFTIKTVDEMWQIVKDM